MATTAKSLVRRNRVPSLREEDELSTTPAIRRRSRIDEGQQRTSRQPVPARSYQQPAQADVLDEEERQQPIHIMTDDLVVNNGPVTRPPQNMKVMPLRTSSCVRLELQGIPRIIIIPALIVIVIVVWSVVWGILSLISFGTDVSNTYMYGPTRTSVVSGVFGIDNDSSASPTSVIAINVKGILVIESLPAGDVSKLKIYPTGFSLVGTSAAKLPVILTIKDLNSDHKPDVEVKIPGQSITLKLVNNGNDFTLTK